MSPASAKPVLSRAFTAAAFATSLAALDLARVLSHSLDRFASARYALAASAVLALAAFALWVVAQFLILRPLSRWARLDPGALAGAVAAAGVAAFALLQQVNPSFSPQAMFATGIVAAAFLLIATGLYALTLRHPAAMRRLGVTGAWAVPAAVFLLWLQERATGGFHVVWSLAALVAAAFAAWALYGWAGRPMAKQLFVPVAVLATVAGAILAPGWGRVTPAASDAAPGGTLRHVILISVDTLRRDALSCYGSASVQTPAIDALAADGCRFDRAVSASSWTLPSFASMFTGLPPAVHGVVRSVSKLPDGVPTLAQRFQEAGYWTKAFVTNPILAPHREFSRGFDDYTFSSNEYSVRGAGERILGRILPDELARAATTTELTDAAVAWVRENRDAPFLLWVHYLDPHLPYTPPERFVEKDDTHELLGTAFHSGSGTRHTMDMFGDASHRAWVRSLYDGEVRYVDHEVGRLLDALRETGIYDDALVVFVSDHGEEFWEHDGFEHGHTLYNEVLLVPFIVKPARYPAGREVEQFVATQDLAQTVLDVAGLPGVDSTFTVSLAPLLDGRPVPRRPIYGGGLLFNTDRESVISNRWKTIRSRVSARLELYDLGADPAERESRELIAPDFLRQGLDLIDYHWLEAEQYRAGSGIENAEIFADPETIERLKALGYL